MGLATSAYRKVAPAKLEQRAAIRHPVVVKRASVRGHGRQPLDAVLDDLSVYGCRLASMASLRQANGYGCGLLAATLSPPARCGAKTASWVAALTNQSPAIFSVR